MSSQRCSPRWATPRNPTRDTHGAKIAWVAKQLGWDLMPWQRAVADVACEIDPATGRLFYQTVVVTVMRQQGKTSLLLPVWAHRAVSWPNVRVAWTMQSAQAARSKWAEEHVPRIQASPLAKLLEPGSKGVRMQNGSEHVKFTNGSMQTLLASTMSAGHGDVVDLGMVDEAMAQRDDRLHQALKPAMKTRHGAGMPGAQLWVVSTMGPDGESVWFNAQVDAGRAAVEQGTCEEDRICYVEYSAPEDADPGDPAVWRACMPALGFTVEESTIRAEYREALLVPDGLAGFRRQALNQRTAQRADPPFPLEVWDSCLSDAVRPVEGLVWAVDVSPDQASAAVGVAWRRPDGVVQVQVVDARPGVGWLPGRVAELRERWQGVWVLDPRGASGSQAAGWPGVTVSAGQVRQGCAELEAAVRSGRLGHFGQPELRAALEGAVRRPSEDGGWSWARRRSAVDISPLVAVSLAHGALVGAVVAPAGDPLLAFF